MEKYFFLFSFFFISSYSLFSAGTADQTDYQSELSVQCPYVIDSIATGEMSSAEGKTMLKELRAVHKVSYSDEAGIIDSFLDQLERGQITREDALLYFSYLKDKKIPEIRKDEGNSSFLEYQKKLLEKYNEVISALLSDDMTIESAILRMEAFQRNSGFLNNKMFIQLQTLLLSYQSGALPGSQLHSDYLSIRDEWMEEINSETAESSNLKDEESTSNAEDNRPAPSDTPEPSDRPDHLEEPDHPDRQDHSDRQDRPGSQNHSDRQDRPDRQDHSDRQDRPGSQDHSR